jgi:hypothetical protein
MIFDPACYHCQNEEDKFLVISKREYLAMLADYKMPTMLKKEDFRVCIVPV